MTGLLGRLAAQAAGAQPLIRPRPRARYEPELGAGGPSDLVEVHQEILPAARSAQPLAQTPQRIEPPALTPERTATGPGDRAAAREPEPRRPAERGTDVLAPRPVAGEREAGEAGSKAIAASASDRRDTGPPTRPAAGPKPREVIAIVGSDSVGGPVAAAPAATTRTDRRTGKPERGLLSTPEVALAPPPPWQPQSGVQRRDTRPQEPAPQPEIHVTIGRVEVRAPAGPASPAPIPAPPAPSPGLGLGDYLRQRSEGSRR